MTTSRSIPLSLTKKETRKEIKVEISFNSFRFSIALLLLLFFMTATGYGQTPANNEGWVVLGVDDYLSLKQRAFPTTPQPPVPPIEASLTRIDYELTVGDGLASGEARLTIDVVKEGWVRVAIPPGLMVREARLDGQPTSLVVDPSRAQTSLLLSKTGRFTLTLGIAAQVASVAGTELLQLPLGSSAICRATVSMPRQDVQAHVAGGLLVEQTNLATGSRWIAYGGDSRSLTFTWKQKVEDKRANQPVRLRGKITQMVGLGEDTTQITTEVQIEVTQGLAREVTLRLPDNFTVNHVGGAVIADWQVSAAGLNVTFIEPIESAARFSINGELKLPRDGTFEIPLLRMPTAERESGAIAVEVLGAGEIKDRRPVGIEETDASGLGQLISTRQSPSMVAFRLPTREGSADRSLSLTVARYTPQSVLTANIDESHYRILATSDGKAIVSTRFAVRNNQKTFLKLKLPSGSQLWAASVAGRSIRPGRAPDGGVLIPLERSRTEESSAFVVEVSYLDRFPAWSEKGRARLALLSADMPISRSRLEFFHPPDYRISPLIGTFRTAPYESPDAARSSNAVTTRESNRLSSLADSATQELVNRVQQAATSSGPVRRLPIRVAFPKFGQALYFVSELTAENQVPQLEFDFARGKKRGDL